MSLNPTRANLINRGVTAAHLSTPFKAEADAALAEFQATRSSLERQVRQGDLTLKVAREKAATAAAQIRERLVKRAEGFSATPRIFVDRLVAVSDARRQARRNASNEALQREIIGLLRQSIVEQQMISRAGEFEAQVYQRPLHGGPAAPTLNSLIGFHEAARIAGDDTALEWTRRHLESFRLRGLSPEENRLIDQTTDRPDRVNDRTVSRFIEAMRGQPAETLEDFVAQALESADANACAAAFLLAREVPEGPAARWVRATLDGLRDFPEAALNSLREWEAEARRQDAEAARAAADYAATVAEVEARFPALHQPSPDDVRRREFQRARSFDSPEEPVGLSFNRRSPRSEVSGSSTEPTAHATEPAPINQTD